MIALIVPGWYHWLFLDDMIDLSGIRWWYDPGWYHWLQGLQDDTIEGEMLSFLKCWTDTSLSSPDVTLKQSMLSQGSLLLTVHPWSVKLILLWRLPRRDDHVSYFHTSSHYFRVTLQGWLNDVWKSTDHPVSRLYWMNVLVASKYRLSRSNDWLINSTVVTDTKICSDLPITTLIGR